MTIAIAGVTGNLTSDPDLRFSPKGDPVVTFGVAVNERVRQGNEWVDGKPEFLRCEAWGQLAENIAESLTKGTSVVLNGRLSTEEFRGRDGEHRTSLKVRVSHIGPQLARQSAKLTRNQNERPMASAGRNNEAQGWA